MNLTELRAELACARDLRFLNYAATAPMLTGAAETMARVARQGTRPLGEHFTAWLALVEGTRRAVAAAIGARTDEVTFTVNTSTALSLIAAAVRWKSGDRVLYPADEFPSNRFVWDNLKELGVRVEPVPPRAGVGLAEQLAALDLAGVRMVALSAVSYRDGRRLDVEEVCSLCRARDILVTVDAIQAVGAIAVDVRGWGCDFLACGGQKWLLGPLGSAFLYIARERLASLHVPTVGWASSRHAGDHEATTLEWCEGAARFEAGLPDVAAIGALGASLERLGSGGWTELFAAVARQRTRLADGLKSRGIALLHDGPAGTTAGIVAASFAESRLEVLVPALERRHVVVTRRGDAVRASAHAVTADEEVDAYLEAVDEAFATRAARVERIATASPRSNAHAPRRVQASPSWRHAVVTGATRGLGAAIAEALAAEGCALTLVARDRAQLEELSARLRAAHDIDVQVLAVDLGNAAAVADGIAGAGQRLAATDLLVNNAARADATPFLEADSGMERAAFETNLFAPMTLARAVLPGMLARGRGAILNMATAGARNALPLFTSYASSKAALWAWSEALGRELDGSGVTVTTFIPPHMDTSTRRQLGRRALAYYDLSGEDADKREGGLERLADVARRALAAAAAGRPLELSSRARWEVALNAVLPGRVRALVRNRWKGMGRSR
jgi:cysteine desulfurase/selenocysteine lyase